MSEVFGPTARLERKVVMSSFSVGILSAWNSWNFDEPSAATGGQSGSVPNSYNLF